MGGDRGLVVIAWLEKNRVWRRVQRSLDGWDIVGDRKGSAPSIPRAGTEKEDSDPEGPLEWGRAQ